MKAYFGGLADALITSLQGDEVLTCGFGGEESDFVRFNRGSVRQAGSVSQQRMGIELIDGRRHASASVTLSGDRDADLARLRGILKDLRERLPHLPEDPYLLYSTDVNSTEREDAPDLPDAGDAVAEIQQAGGDRDLVGIYASGGIYSGFANSLGQRNWYGTHSFNFDWSFYHAADKAVKSSYAGFRWDPEAFGRKVTFASKQLQALGRSAHTIDPGRYRVYLTPAAVYDILGLLSWGGFGLKALKTRQTPLLKLATGEAKLSDAITLKENTAGGIAPDFQEEGFLRPAEISLIQAGAQKDCLVSPRSAKEYDVPTNGASAWETPESLDLAAGTLPSSEVLHRLDRGIYVGNVWYLNYSDRTACRTTGMTRFATFWVENGEIVAPLNVMRFDETIFRMLGDNLVDLTAEREMMLDAGTYFERATASGHLPGALVEDFNFTL